ncbi:relaxase/mobilization nuclease domain-containing protein [Pseudovibrio sp. WM33]|uniref:relaxase/mobilization nuclease domain-containing protein n=1 Tax=Pseudovibrio sp. WM33 TaxID=1735585 RepID=UPI0007AEE567|nr:relaxase/mobilization nuclease domain-containing protein [Pseudovibrio sp. WM33]KZL28010.1 DNA relaxase MbeA [Pseudovibrio sp. WM33]
MLIKFFKNGQGGGAAPVDYLIADKVLAYDDNRNLLRNASGTPLLKGRDPLPEVLAGNPEHTKLLIDSSRHKWSYRAGVVSFDTADNPSEEQQQEVMETFENLAFSGLEPEQFDMLWVRHTHEGRVELHFCTPRLELTTGNSLNIAPPGYIKAMDALRDMLNKEHGWADPQDPARARETKFTTERKDRASSREEIQHWLEEQIVAGTITNRPEMIEALQSAGFEIPRRGKNYLTVKDPETDTRWRLKGTLFHEGWTREDLTQRTLENKHARRTAESSRLDGLGLSELRERYQGHIERRANYNQKRFGRTAQSYRERDRARAERLENAFEVAPPPSSLVTSPASASPHSLSASDPQPDMALGHTVPAMATFQQAGEYISGEKQRLPPAQPENRHSSPLRAAGSTDLLQQYIEVIDEYFDATRTPIAELYKSVNQGERRPAQFAERIRKTLDGILAQQSTLHWELTKKLHSFAITAQLFARRVFLTIHEHYQSERNYEEHPTFIAPTRRSINPRRPAPSRSEPTSFDR